MTMEEVASTTGEDVSELKVSKNLGAKFPELKSLVQLATCPVCYSCIRDGVSTLSCGHNFCSLCVRDYLTYKQQCPSCLRELHEAGLWTNKPLQIIVEQLIKLVPKLEKHFKKDQLDGTTNA